MEMTASSSIQPLVPPTAHDISQLSPDNVFKALAVDADGLTEQEANGRLALFGPNRFVPRGRPRRWLALMTSPIRPLLLPIWIAAAIGYLIGDQEIGFVLAIVALINTAVGILLERKTERTTAALSDALPSYAHVIRDGRDHHIIAAQVVPGDLLLLHGGETIPADARVIDEHDLRTVNVALTGEAAATRKVAGAVLDEELLDTELSNLVYAGARVASGSGRAVVYATGRNTAYGTIAALTESAHEEPSPLLWVFARLGSVSTFLALLAAVIGGAFARFVVGLNIHDTVLVGIGLLMAAVPVGLMPGIAVTLLEGSRRLARHGARVRRLSSVETLGATTVICADKTGTLTQNEMTVREIWTAEGTLRVGGVGYTPVGQFSTDDKTLDQASVRRRCGELLRAAVLTSSARLLPPDTLRPHWHILGDSTEAALIVAATKAGYHASDLYDTFPQLVMLPATDALPLEGHVVQDRAGCLAYLKGPPNLLVPRCTSIATQTGVHQLTDHDRAAIRRVLRHCERGAMRMVAFARRDLQSSSAHQVPQTDDIAHQLVFLGLMAAVDPPRLEVEEAIRACHRAGIRTMMLTGDSMLGAESVARRCALVESSRATTITGIELAKMDDATLRERLRVGDIVFARMTPEHKVRVVETLDAMGEVVLVTGGAANDVPAIKAADIGVAMGTSSSAATREAADVILEQDNFATVAQAIAEGRSVEQRARRLVALNLAVTVIKLAAYVVALTLGWPLLLTVGQLLVIDLLGGFLPAIALGAGPSNPLLMQRRPRRSGRALIDFRIYRIGYAWFGLLGTTAALIAAALMMLATGFDPAGGGRFEGSSALDHYSGYPNIATAYLAAGLAALVGAGLRLRSSARPYPFGRALFALVLIGIATTLVAIARLPTLQPLVELSSLPWWLWTVAVLCMLVAALLEWGRQQVDHLPK